MADKPVITVQTYGGRLVGVIKDAKIDMNPDHEYEVTGTFEMPGGRVVDRVEFNPQVLPYILDITGQNKCSHTSLHMGYVQRGRQPVRITASCKTS